MKNSKIWYLGYVLGFCSLVLVLALKLNEALKIFLTFIFAMSISVSHVNIMHNKMIKNDKSYKIDVNDERNEKIRDKVNAMIIANYRNSCSYLYFYKGIFTGCSFDNFNCMFTSYYVFYN